MRTPCPEAKLLEVRFDEPADRNIDRAFRDNATVLRDRLGTPNWVDMPESHHLMWHDDHVSVDYAAGVPERRDAERTHSFSVCCHAGIPRAWAPAGEKTLGEVKRLLNLMPGVEVCEVRRRPEHTSLELAVRTLPSVARLAHVAFGANVRLQVGIDEGRWANGGLPKDDPAGIRYHIEVAGPREPEPGASSSTALQILGIYLAHDLQDQGILGEGEARRLEWSFINLKP